MSSQMPRGWACQKKAILNPGPTRVLASLVGLGRTETLDENRTGISYTAKVVGSH